MVPWQEEPKREKHLSFFTCKRCLAFKVFHQFHIDVLLTTVREVLSNWERPSGTSNGMGVDSLSLGGHKEIKVISSHSMGRWCVKQRHPAWNAQKAQDVFLEGKDKLHEWMKVFFDVMGNLSRNSRRGEIDLNTKGKFKMVVKATWMRLSTRGGNTKIGTREVICLERLVLVWCRRVCKGWGTSDEWKRNQSERSEG